MLLNKGLNFQLNVKMLPCFAEKYVSTLCRAKASNIFAANNITAINFVRIGRLNKSSTNDCIKLKVLVQLAPNMLETRNFMGVNACAKYS